MEATGDYWKPVFFLLESRGFDCQLYNAAQVKALPGQAQDRPGRLDLAGQDHRARLGLLQLRAARADPPPAHPHPLPPAPHPGPHRREAAGGETARRRAPEAVPRDLRHPRRLGPGHAERDRRRAARPPGTGPALPGQVDHSSRHGIGPVCARTSSPNGTDMTGLRTASHLVSGAMVPQVPQSAGKSRQQCRRPTPTWAALGEARSASRSQSFPAQYRRHAADAEEEGPRRDRQLRPHRRHALLSDPAASYPDLGPAD